MLVFLRVEIVSPEMSSLLSCLRGMAYFQRRRTRASSAALGLSWRQRPCLRHESSRHYVAPAISITAVIIVLMLLNGIMACSA